MQAYTVLVSLIESLLDGTVIWLGFIKPVVSMLRKLMFVKKTGKQTKKKMLFFLTSL